MELIIHFPSIREPQHNTKYNTNSILGIWVIKRKHSKRLKYSRNHVRRAGEERRMKEGAGRELFKFFLECAHCTPSTSSFSPLHFSLFRRFHSFIAQMNCCFSSEMRNYLLLFVCSMFCACTLWLSGENRSSRERVTVKASLVVTFSSWEALAATGSNLNLNCLWEYLS